MPKFTDLPEAITSKDNDVICIADPDSGISKRMTIETLRGEILPRQALGGEINAGADFVLTDGDPVTYLSGFSVGLGGADPVTGIMNPEGSLLSKVRAAMQVFQVTAQKDAGIQLWMKLIDDVNPDVEIIIDEIWYIHANQDNIFFNALPVLFLDVINIEAPYTIQWGLKAVAKTMTVNVPISSLTTEAV